MGIMIFGLRSWEEENVGVGDTVLSRSLELFLLDTMVNKI